MARCCGPHENCSQDWRESAVQDGRIHIEKINGPFLFGLKATPDEFLAGLDRAIERGWLILHESGTYVKFTQMARQCFKVILL